MRIPHRLSIWLEKASQNTQSSSELKNRVASGVLMALFFTALYLGLAYSQASILFALLIATAVGAVGYEYIKLTSTNALLHRLFPLLAGGLSFLVMVLKDQLSIFSELYLFLSAGLWLYLILKMLKVIRSPIPWLSQFKHPRLIQGLVLLVASAWALASLFPDYAYLPFVVAAISDTSAYFTGRQFGKHKLAPKLSPGKSWEGLLGAAAGITLFWFAFSFWALNQGLLTSLILSPIFGAIASVIGLMGDLFQSSLKRSAGVKHSGTWIPGHGGLYDRLDALLPLALFISLWLGV